MGVLKTKVLWYKKGNTSEYIDLEDFLTISVSIGLNSKANTSEITLKNSFEEYNDITGKFQFNEDDVIKIFAKLSEDDVNIDVTKSDDLIMVTNVKEWNGTLTNKGSHWKIKCMDWTQHLLNKVWASSYNDTAPNIIINIIRHVSENDNGNFNINNVKYDISANTTTNSGYVTDTRPDGSAFPTIKIGRTFKPVYDWISELSQPDSTNSTTEINNNELVSKKAYMFYVDENKYFHWDYPSNDTIEYYFEEGKIKGDNYRTTTNRIDSKILNINITKLTYNNINFIIFEAGKDMNDVGIYDYYFDPSTTSANSKMSFKKYPYIVKDLLYYDYLNLDASNRVDTNSTPDNPSFPSSYPYTPIWTNTATNSNTEYNSSLRTASRVSGKIKAQAIIQKYGNPRYKGKIKLQGIKINPGSYIKITSNSLGIIDHELRIIDVNHQIGSNTWETTITVEEDEKERT